MTEAVALVVLDVDGTIIANQGPPTVSPSVLEAIHEVRRAGVLVTLATGRTLDYVMAHLAEPLGLTSPVVTAQGALVGDPATGAVLTRRTIPAPLATEALARIDETGHLAVLYLLAPDGSTRMFERGASVAEHDDLFGRPRERVDLLAAVDWEEAEPLKIIVEAPVTANGHDPVAAIGGLVGGGLQVVRTHPRLVEITAAGVDKGSGLRDLCGLLGIDPARAMAVGDNDNDVPMLRVAGVAVALGDGSVGARAAAHWVAPPFGEDGAAVALRAALR